MLPTDVAAKMTAPTAGPATVLADPHGRFNILNSQAAHLEIYDEHLSSYIGHIRPADHAGGLAEVENFIRTTGLNYHDSQLNSVHTAMMHFWIQTHPDSKYQNFEAAVDGLFKTVWSSSFLTVLQEEGLSHSARHGLDLAILAELAFAVVAGSQVLNYLGELFGGEDTVYRHSLNISYLLCWREDIIEPSSKQHIAFSVSESPEQLYESQCTLSD